MDPSGPILPAEEGLALVGYRATGKTTVGRLLADRLHRPFLDADSRIERETGASIRAIFELRGEDAFRILEEACLADLTATHPGAVIATGGGAILRESNRLRLKEYGRVIWLDAPPEILVDRLRRDANQRPALTPAGTLAEVSRVLKAREPLYRELADLVIDASGTAESVAEAVLKGLSATGGRR